MTAELQAAIESYLLKEPGDDGWFHLAAIVERFGLSDDRELRAVGRTPGPLSRCAIFSGRGVKHRSLASLRERLACKHRVTRELLSRVRKLRWMKEGDARILDGGTEKHTGQSLLFTP